jgi:hypothetical protein
MISTVAFATALYSASVLDLETVDGFLALHETRSEPRVDLLSSKHPAQSALENPLTSIEGDLVIRNPIPIVPLTYLRVLFTATRCRVVGECKY